MESSDKKIQEIRDILEKEHSRGFSLEEAAKAAWDIETLTKITAEVALEEWRRQKLLKEHPKSFRFDRNGILATSVKVLL